MTGGTTSTADEIGPNAGPGLGERPRIPRRLDHRLDPSDRLRAHPGPARPVPLTGQRRWPGLFTAAQQEKRQQQNSGAAERDSGADDRPTRTPIRSFTARPGSHRGTVAHPPDARNATG